MQHLTDVNMIRKKRRAPPGLLPATLPQHTSSIEQGFNLRAGRKDQDLGKEEEANDKVPTGTNEVGHQEGVSAIDGNYEDDLAEALRRSKIDAQCRQCEKAKIASSHDDEAGLHKTLESSEKEDSLIEDEADEELQMVLEMSKHEPGGDDNAYDPDQVGETSRMGAMRNGHGGTARGPLPD